MAPPFIHELAVRELFPEVSDSSLFPFPRVTQRAPLLIHNRRQRQRCHLPDHGAEQPPAQMTLGQQQPAVANVSNLDRRRHCTSRWCWLVSDRGRSPWQRQPPR